MNGGLHAVSIRKPSERMSNFWTVWFLKPNFDFPHIPINEIRIIILILSSSSSSHHQSSSVDSQLETSLSSAACLSCLSSYHMASCGLSLILPYFIVIVVDYVSTYDQSIDVYIAMLPALNIFLC